MYLDKITFYLILNMKQLNSKNAFITRSLIYRSSFSRMSLNTSCEKIPQTHTIFANQFLIGIVAVSTSMGLPQLDEQELFYLIPLYLYLPPASSPGLISSSHPLHFTYIAATLCNVPFLGSGKGQHYPLMPSLLWSQNSPESWGQRSAAWRIEMRLGGLDTDTKLTKTIYLRHSKGGLAQNQINLQVLYTFYMSQVITLTDLFFSTYLQTSLSHPPFNKLATLSQDHGDSTNII